MNWIDEFFDKERDEEELAMLKDMMALELDRDVIQHVQSQEVNWGQLLADRCCRALCEIRAVLSEACLNDTECVEHIVRVLERYGTDAGEWHGQ